MNALAQKYNCGHASIEEHPESKLYFDKADQYLNEKALNNIEAPEIKNVSDLENLIKNNDVIIIDSYAKMQEIEKGFEVDKDLRKKIQREIIFSNISANQRRQNAWLF
jgi:ornithine carbamoyltransferase